jgi:hypothetical protein
LKSKKRGNGEAREQAGKESKPGQVLPPVGRRLFRERMSFEVVAAPSIVLETLAYRL